MTGRQLRSFALALPTLLPALSQQSSNRIILHKKLSPLFTVSPFFLQPSALLTFYTPLDYHKRQRSSFFFHKHASSPLCQASRRTLMWEAASAAVTMSTSVLSHTHAVVGPWYLAIPTFSILINLVFRAPFMWFSIQQANLDAKINQITSVYARQALTLQNQSWDSRHKSYIAYYLYINSARRRLGIVRLLTPLRLATLSILLAGSESVRRLTGAPWGLFGLLRPAPDQHKDDFGVTEYDLIASDITTDSVTNIDPSLTWEGALWFRDLATADPFHILPLAMGGVIIYNMIPRSSAESLRMFATLRFREDPALKSVSSRARIMFRRAALMWGLAMPFVFWNAPAGVCLFWLTSSLFTIGSRLLLRSGRKEGQLYMKHIATIKKKPFRIGFGSLPQRKLTKTENSTHTLDK